MSFDVYSVRRDFPILDEILSEGNKLVYFDNGATSQKPMCTIEALKHYYMFDNANIHRSSHELSRRATTQYEDSRKKVKKFFNVGDDSEVIFTRGATESLNIVAYSWGEKFLKEKDEVILSMYEHHANIVPWQILAEKIGFKIKVVPLTKDGDLDYKEFKKIFSHNTKIVSISHASNVLGTITDIEKISRICRKKNVLLNIDASQSAPHFLVDLNKIDCDFLSLSSHKCFGPTGIGVLIAKKRVLDSMNVWMGGGDMIENVSWSCVTFRDSPEKFEAGTPNIADAISFGSTLDYLSTLDFNAISDHEKKLLNFCTKKLCEIEGLKIFGMAKDKLPVISFSVDGVHPNDISALLDASGIAVRTGHHCAEPLMTYLGVKGTCRVSLAFYNTIEEIEFFVEKLKSSIKILK